MRRPHAGTWLLLALAFATPRSVAAQSGWDATLVVMPFPSPYLSDWETNPNVATYTLINGTDAAQDVILHYEVRNQNGALLTSGRSDPQSITPGVPAVYTSLDDIAGRTDHDPAVEDDVSRSGRLPEGDYTACVVATATSGFVLAQACETFTLVYPDPPLLIAPADGETVTTPSPIFQWTPLQVPADYTLHFALRVAEVRPGQTPFTALSANLPQFEDLDVSGASFTYPADGLPLESGKTYAWRVVAIDQNGYAAATNGGSSELWTFRYDDGSGVPPEIAGATPIQLSLKNQPDQPLATAPEEDETTGLSQICSRWDDPRPLEALNLPIAARIFFPNDLSVRAGLIRKELPGGHRVWAAVGALDPFTVLAYGDCAGPLDRTVLRWVGARRTADAQELNAWLVGAATGAPITLPTDSAGPKLKFGVAIFSFYDMTASGDSLEAVDAFLESYSVDVQPGFNFYGVIDGARVPALNAIAEALHTTTKDFELQGFAGLNVSHSVGVSYGSVPGPAGDSPAYLRTGAGADVSTEVIILWLRGALPKWEHPWGWDKIQSLQLGLEVVVKDSLAYGAGREPGLANTFETVITPTLELVTPGGVTWRGAVGADFEGKTPKFIVNLQSDAQWQPGPLAGTAIYLTGLELQLDIYKGLIDAIRQGNAGLIDWNLDINASLGVASEPAVAKLGVTFGRKADDPDKYWGDLAAKDSAQAQAELLLIAITRDRLDKAEAHGDTAGAAQYRAELESRSKMLDETLENLRNATAGRELAAKAKGNAPLLKSERGAWWWRARLSFGNMSLLDFIDLIRKAQGGPR